MRLLGLLPAILLCLLLAGSARAEHGDPQAHIVKSLKFLKNEKQMDAFYSLDKIDTSIYKALKPKVDYLSGFALFRAGLLKSAEERLYAVSDDPLMGDYALFHIAEIQAGERRYEEAIKTADLLSEKFPYSILLGKTTLRKAKVLNSAGREKEAVKLLEKYLAQNPENASEALWQLAINLEKTGDNVKAYKTYQKIFYRHPYEGLAERARVETLRMRKIHGKILPPAPISEKIARIKLFVKHRMYKEAESSVRAMKLSGLTNEQRAKLLLWRAKSLDKTGRDDEAIALYQRIVYKMPKTPSRVSAMYHMAKAHWNMGSNFKAEHVMKQLIAEYPKNDKAAYALYVAGRIAESRGDYRLAIRRWNKVVNRYPKMDVAEVCMWRIGFRRYLMGDYKKAEKVFDDFMGKYPQSRRVGKILYWKGRSIAKRGGEKELAIFERLMDEFPLSYYSMLASGSIDRRFYTQVPHFTPYAEKLDEIINQSVNSVADKYRRQPELSDRQKWFLKTSQNWVDLGFVDRAGPLLDKLAKEVKPDSGHLVWICQLYYRAGYYGKIPWRLQPLLEKPGIPKEQKVFLTMMMYPLPHWQTIVVEAKRNNIDPMLALAVIRQESRFDADSVSSSNARGLMQIIPPTAMRISKVLDMEDYSDAMLHEPDTNIRMGIFYLAALIKKSKGEIVPALASYNAGARVVQKWLKRIPYEEVEVFIESIPYPETRRYVKNVLRNYGVYKNIYDNAETYPRSKRQPSQSVKPSLFDDS